MGLCAAIPFASACELTEEYIEARKEFAKLIKAPYNDCLSSVRSAEYWYKYTQCIQNKEEGEDRLLRCGHWGFSSNDQYKGLQLNTDHCEVLNKSTVEKTQLLQLYMKEKGIKRCK